VKWVLSLLLFIAAPAFSDESESAWVRGEVVSKRFFGEVTTGPKFDDGARVVVLTRDGGLVRVQLGNRFGWVPEAALTSTAPEGAATPPAGMPPMLLPPTE